MRIEKKQQKIAIHFLNIREERATWNKEPNSWWSSTTDFVHSINNELDKTKTGNYWQWLKGGLESENVEVVSATHSFKFDVSG